MIASLPMYDRPETAAANDRFWQAIREQLGAGPESLTRDSDLAENWLNPDLLLSQTCGYPYRAGLHGKVGLVGTPNYGLPDCPPGYYFSVMIARKDDPRTELSEFADAPMAYNASNSQSGWAAPQNHAATLGFQFRNLVAATGGHIASVRAVAEGRADVAAIDALTWALCESYDDLAKGIKIIASTPPTPTLPYITALGNDANVLFSAITLAIDDLSPPDRALLHLKGLIRIDADKYLAVPTPAAPEH